MQDAAPGGVRPGPFPSFPTHEGPVHLARSLGPWPALTEGAARGPLEPRHTSDSRLEKCADPLRVPRSPPRCLRCGAVGSCGPQCAAWGQRRAWREGPVSLRVGAARGQELRSSSDREVGAGGGRSQPPAARLCRWWCGAAAGARCEARGRCGCGRGQPQRALRRGGGPAAQGGGGGAHQPPSRPSCEQLRWRGGGSSSRLAQWRQCHAGPPRGGR